MIFHSIQIDNRKYDYMNENWLLKNLNNDNNISESLPSSWKNKQ